MEGGNNRIFYTLKSFDLKRLDIYRRKAFREIASGEVKRVRKGLKALIMLTMFMTFMEANADTIIDIFLGRPINFTKAFMTRLRHFAISRYMQRRARREGWGKATWEQIIPPTQFVDSIGKDIASAGDKKGLETTKSIPLVGKWYYWNFGKGASKIEKQKAKEEKETNVIRRIRPERSRIERSRPTRNTVRRRAVGR